MGVRTASRWLVVVAIVAGAGCSSVEQSATPAADVSTSAPPTALTIDTTATSDEVSSTDPPTDSPTDSSITSSSDGGTTSSGVPTTTPTTPTPAPDASTTSPAPTTMVPRPIDPAAPTGPCAMSPVGAFGEITWIRDGQLLSTGDGVSSTCLANGVTATEPTQWSPTGEAALIESATVIGADSTRPSGFAVGRPFVSWSQPTGKALIEVDPTTHRLIWRSATSEQTQDISFLDRTDLAMYHPAGKAIVAVGVDENGQYGIWLASNRGENRTLITSIDDPSTPATDLAFSADGSSLYFVHGFLHQLGLFDLRLFEIGVADRSEANITASTVEPVFAISTGPCDMTGSIVVYPLGPTRDLRTDPASPFDDTQTIRPVGWLAGGRLVISASHDGCDGPADVWTWTADTGAYQQIGSGWDAVSVRIARGPFVDLPDKIEQAAPG